MIHSISVALKRNRDFVYLKRHFSRYGKIEITSYRNDKFYICYTEEKSAFNACKDTNFFVNLDREELCKFYYLLERVEILKSYQYDNQLEVVEMCQRFKKNLLQRLDREISLPQRIKPTVTIHKKEENINKILTEINEYINIKLSEKEILDFIQDFDEIINKHSISKEQKVDFEEINAKVKDIYEFLIQNKDQKTNHANEFKRLDEQLTYIVQILKDEKISFGTEMDLFF